MSYHHHHHHHHHHQSLDREGRWDTTDDFTTSLMTHYSELPHTHSTKRTRDTVICVFYAFTGRVGTPARLFPKPSFRVPWKVGDTVVGRGNAGLTLKSGHSCPCQNCSQRPPAKKTGRGSLLSRLSCPPDDPINHGTELN